MREWIDIVKNILFENDSTNSSSNVVPFPKVNRPVSNLTKARGGADIYKIRPKTDSLDEFTRGYIEAALWTSTDDYGEPLDSKYDIDDIHVDTLIDMIKDCKDIQKQAKSLLDDAY